MPYCPAGSPDCDEATHECSAASGSVLLKRIVVKTSGCESCSPSDEGITLQLTGLQSYIKCNTNNLNHADKTDFSPSQNGEFFTDTDDKVDDGWGACYEVRGRFIDFLKLIIFFSERPQRRGERCCGELGGIRELDS